MTALPMTAQPMTAQPMTAKPSPRPLRLLVVDGNTRAQREEPCGGLRH